MLWIAAPIVVTACVGDHRERTFAFVRRPPQPPRRLPHATFKHVLRAGQVASVLRWSLSRVRRYDWLFRPVRLADGSRAFDLERVLAYVAVQDFGEWLFWRNRRLERQRARRLELAAREPVTDAKVVAALVTISGYGRREACLAASVVSLRAQATFVTWVRAALRELWRNGDLRRAN
ncbi:MAG TPA: hypothetical protein VGL61_31440 [Kofleriaceae bacterium]